MKAFNKIIVILIVNIFFLNACGGKLGDARKIPTNAQERARKNVEEGRGASIGGLLGRTGKTNYEFSSSNPMWRASLEIPVFFMENDPPQAQMCLRTHPILPTPQGNLSSLFHRIDGVCRGL